MPVEAIRTIHKAEVSAEEEMASEVVSTVVVGRGTPIEAALTNADTRRPAAVARRRKKDTIAIRSSYFTAGYSALACPCPSASIF